MPGGPPKLGFITICQQTGKRGYGDRKVARKAKKSTMLHNGEKASDWDIYQCSHCNMFHIGHHNKYGA